MATAKLYPPSKNGSQSASPLPQLIQTPSGFALLELQGTINLPQDADGIDLANAEIGRIDFPDYDPDVVGSAWMKRVLLFVGQHQRLNGEVRKLPKALAVVRRRENRVTTGSGGDVEEQGDNLEVVEIVKYKLIFSNRPEPVSTTNNAP
ncbi:chromosome transmission fidelity protein 8 [Dactylonectria estremocensis]|uniref:Chromosome transmission fidelity protein 8 n=1 Tax=Dactylonectria estremocensis TaxID=1079267 RepID=A0A9P9F4E4_9HYPO|nr:chromosome transmission fidelity protein 8 [Dactylonectria estremocensis]